MTLAAPALPVRCRPDPAQAEPDEARVTIAQSDTIGAPASQDTTHAERTLHAAPNGLREAV